MRRHVTRILRIRDPAKRLVEIDRCALAEDIDPETAVALRAELAELLAARDEAAARELHEATTRQSVVAQIATRNAQSAADLELKLVAAYRQLLKERDIDLGVLDTRESAELSLDDLMDKLFVICRLYGDLERLRTEPELMSSYSSYVATDIARLDANITWVREAIERQRSSFVPTKLADIARAVRKFHFSNLRSKLAAAQEQLYSLSARDFSALRTVEQDDTSPADLDAWLSEINRCLDDLYNLSTDVEIMSACGRNVTALISYYTSKETLVLAAIDRPRLKKPLPVDDHSGTEPAVPMILSEAKRHLRSVAEFVIMAAALVFWWWCGNFIYHRVWPPADTVMASPVAVQPKSAIDYSRYNYQVVTIPAGQSFDMSIKSDLMNRENEIVPRCGFDHKGWANYIIGQLPGGDQRYVLSQRLTLKIPDCAVALP